MVDDPAVREQRGRLAAVEVDRRHHVEGLEDPDQLAGGRAGALVGAPDGHEDGRPGARPAEHRAREALPHVGVGPADHRGHAVLQEYRVAPEDVAAGARGRRERRRRPGREGRERRAHGRDDDDLARGHVGRVGERPDELQRRGRVEGGRAHGGVDLGEAVRRPARRPGGRDVVGGGVEERAREGEVHPGVAHGQFLVDSRDRDGRTIYLERAGPVESLAHRVLIKVHLLVGDLGGVQQHAVLDDPAHHVTRVDRAPWGDVEEVPVHRRHAPRGRAAHDARSLERAVDGVVGEADGE